MMEFNVYCDESCHLQHDLQTAMVVGAVWCPTAKAHEVAERIREIKEKHGLARWFEVKWTKVSPAKLDLYVDLIDYFFDDDDLRFRAVIIPDKTKLRHDEFGQDHDTFYYKTYYMMLRAILSPDERYTIYLDIKDSRSHAKEQKLRDVLCNALYDRDRNVIQKLQSVRSHEVEQIQLADLLIGAVSFVNRQDLGRSAAKRTLVERIRKRSGYRLTLSTLMRSEKVNLFRWQAQ
jgi:hypothetical protein